MMPSWSRASRLLVVAAVMSGGLSFALSACAAETGIRGTVLWGPVKPGPTRLGDSDEAPLSTSFTVYDGERRVATFKSAADGSFELSLPAGDYMIVPHEDTPIPYATKQATQVTVPNDGFAVLTIRLDTGMR